MSLIIFTMLFNGGLIPNFLFDPQSASAGYPLGADLSARSLSAFNIILLINFFFRSLPVSLLEATKLGRPEEVGRSPYQIVLAAFQPIMATLALCSWRWATGTVALRPSPVHSGPHAGPCS